MKFQASFLENHINISTKECNRIFGLGRITFGVATGNYGALSILFPVHELDALRDKANSLLELCFSSKKGEDKLSAYYKCEEEFSLCGGCILSEKKAIVNTDDNIDIISVRPYTDFEDVLKKANDTEAGLTSYLFGHDARAIARAYEVLEFGELYVNGFSTGPMLPHCGVRESGVGCDASGWGLEEYFSLKRLSMHP